MIIKKGGIMKKLIILISLLLFIPNIGVAKAYKGYVAHYWTAFAIEKDEGNGGPSYYKHYVTKAFNNKSDCIYYTQRITETSEMEKRYPIYGTVYQVWFMGCDKRW
jgi:hypothetical protein